MFLGTELEPPDFPLRFPSLFRANTKKKPDLLTPSPDHPSVTARLNKQGVLVECSHESQRNPRILDRVDHQNVFSGPLPHVDPVLLS